jgi:probable rRNA maturation factor
MKRSGPRASPDIELQVEDPNWRGADLELLRKAARLTLKAAQRDGTLTILLADDGRLSDLNRKFRGKPKPTNVLSFPSNAGNAGYLGDIAIAFGVTEREAADSGKSLTHHAAHLVAHGVLHLLGYDHGAAAEARVMEGLEVAVLKQMGIADPYEPSAACRVDATHGA